jgi:hypothetical protein
MALFRKKRIIRGHVQNNPRPTRKRQRNHNRLLPLASNHHAQQAQTGEKPGHPTITNMSNIPALVLHAQMRNSCLNRPETAFFPKAAF